MKTITNKFIALGKAVVQTETEAVQALIERIDEQFAKACELLIQVEGRIVVTGMGKSGHIGGKIAATLASTGSPSFFVHPGEASHGDMGMITKKDAVIAISNSGETNEILTILPLIKRLGVPLISLTSNPKSTLALCADISLDISVKKEACALGLAPTSSTTVTLVMGDALAIALLDAKGFSAEDFALSHPGGSLGRRLLLKIDDILHTGNAIPIVQQTATVKEALIEMTRCNLGITAIVDSAQKQIGLFTDGDLRRALDLDINISKTPITQVMTPRGKVINKGLLAAEALRIMESNKINALLVVDEDRKLVGALNMHDLLRAGVM
ncbi:KpsF/GutQ family sugar-phosphate isomerase [Candidatus Berkiella cookevillensis]|uniref:Arabinose 5-phosphate isomerase n=1 Tax=Candidatus Berkiella cookevillensis TaxID=437022 RepID=A0A0Q9YBY8_9GAMM|nr:KpsF/GutQ family sugar-phosphate isomerase [Candidatus Berkiella cookevillensis]MCS5709233.1 KpsF/GutQ family sugar-phosphate isomerase [Candidatus Berkiella cookevillensis]